MENGATILDLKELLNEEEGVGNPERQKLYYFGCELTNDLELVEDFVGILGNEFCLVLPKASSGTESPRFIITGKERKFKAILMQSNKDMAVELPRGSFFLNIILSGLTMIFSPVWMFFRDLIFSRGIHQL